jgi:transcription initiation factor IIE alpha subunit
MQPEHREYECPNCGDWVAILHTTPGAFDCPWCKEPLTLSTDAEFRDGMWRDLSRLVSNRPHIERMIKMSKLAKAVKGNQ